MEKHVLINYMEISVNHYYNSMKGKFDNVCSCERCELDIKALALNKLKPHYVVTDMGKIWLKIDEMKVQFEVDVIRAITEAIAIVKDNPRHDKCKESSCNISLIGMMGSGKTTVMKKIKEVHGYEAIDTDSQVVEKLGMSISQVFYELGEEYFRSCESDVVKDISLKSGCVVSTGGGVIKKKENIDALKKNGKIVYLKASEKELVKRLIREAESRPLIADYASNEETLSKRIKELIEEREPLYLAAADIIIDTDEKSPYQIANEIMEKIK